MNNLNTEIQEKQVIAYQYTKSGAELEKEIVSFEASDYGNAKAIYMMHGQEFCYNESFGVMHYDGRRWATEGAAQQLNEAIVNTLVFRSMVANRQGKTDVAKKCITDNRVIAACKAQFLLLPEVFAPASEFDANPDFLNCNNGVVNLRTGQLLPHDPNYKLTHLTAVDYDPTAKFDQWMDWLAEVILDFDNPEVQAYIQQSVGYSLTGYTREECLFYLYGATGRNGKGLFCSVLQSMLGGLATTRTVNTLAKKRDGADQGFDLAGLVNKRVVIASESEKKRELNEAMVKTITGRDELPASFKGKDHFEFIPKFKVWVASNFPPKGDVDDDAFWGRFRLVVFPNSFLGREDTTLKERFNTPEFLQGVLAWAVQGSVDWFTQHRIIVPEVFKQTLSDTRSEYDTVQQWLTSGFVTVDESAIAQTTMLFNSYESYCRAESYADSERLKRKAFTASLKRKGYSDGQKRFKNTHTGDSTNERVVLGLSLA